MILRQPRCCKSNALNIYSRPLPICSFLLDPYNKSIPHMSTFQKLLMNVSRWMCGKSVPKMEIEVPWFHHVSNPIILNNIHAYINILFATLTKLLAANGLPAIYFPAFQRSLAAWRHSAAKKRPVEAGFACGKVWYVFSYHRNICLHRIQHDVYTCWCHLAGSNPICHNTLDLEWYTILEPPFEWCFDHKLWDG